jgi:hypothetical protein
MNSKAAGGLKEQEFGAMCRSAEYEYTIPEDAHTLNTASLK